MKVKQSKVAARLAALLFFWALSPLWSDSLELENGPKYENVRLLYGGSLVIVIFKDGKVKRFPVADARNIRFESVDWERGDLKRRVQELKRRVFRMSEIERTRQSSLWRSALLPGWGHEYSGYKGHALILNISYLTALGGYLLADRDHARLRNEYNELGLPLLLTGRGPVGFLASQARFLDLRRQVESRRERGNQLLSIAIAVWGWSMFDTYRVNNPEKAFAGLTPPSNRNGFRARFAAAPDERGRWSMAFRMELSL